MALPCFQSISPVRLLAFLTRVALLAPVIFIVSGCSGDGDSRHVDFSKTIEITPPENSPIGQARLRVAVAAMVSPKETFIHYQELLKYLGAKLNLEVELVQRKTYGEINDLLGKGEIDLAFLCSGPYAMEKDTQGLTLLATPEINGSHFYQAYLIVNEKSNFKNLEDLRGKTFAFTDPDSNTGRLVPSNWLWQIGERPETFFEHSIYTYSHDNSIMAVAKGMVDGASVDGLIWDFYNQRKPEITKSTRVIRKSAPFGIPPLVASGTLPDELKVAVRNTLFSMHQDPEGKKILHQLMIDRFIDPLDEWYDGIREISRKAVSGRGVTNEKP